LAKAGFTKDSPKARKVVKELRREEKNMTQRDRRSIAKKGR
jgi:hypothetical protein